jgi:hypothetical protein
MRRYRRGGVAYRRRGGIARDLAKGAVAGAVATWVMGKVKAYAYEQESGEARQAEQRAHRARSRAAGAVKRAAEAVGEPLAPEQQEQVAESLRWALGIGAGALYAVLRRRLDPFGRMTGTAFGTAFWTLLDEGVVPALGLSAPPGALPWQTHARGVLGHVTFGAVTDGTLRLLDAVA